MKEIILHTGFHKTGSSSLQMFGFKHFKALKSRGICYPRIFYKNLALMNHSLILWNLFCRRCAKGYHFNVGHNIDIDDFRACVGQELDQLLQEEERILISGEDICSLTPDELLEMTTYLERYGHKVRCVGLVRSPLSLLASAAQQIIKTGHLLSHNFKGHIRVLERVENLKSVFENPVFYPYQEARTSEKGLIPFILEDLLEIGTFPDLVHIQKNKSFSNLAVRIMSHINEVEPLFLNGEVNPKRVPYDFIPFSELKGKPFRFSADELLPYEEHILEENQKLAQSLGPAFCDEGYEDGSLFERQSVETTELVMSDEELESLKRVLDQVPEHLRTMTNDFLARTLVCKSNKEQ